ncbi:MAG: DUF3570 domain-containing protein [Steroidobacteraceae bacterium]|jgi:hypothetical protein|nr:DUF3570 domain-containing protein [Steroidobacteraceae bacterium]
MSRPNRPKFLPLVPAAAPALLVGAALLGTAGAAHGAVLPEERADAMYKTYDGGGLLVKGPAVLVRKNFMDKVSVSAGYSVDQVSGASIDMVVLGASELREERKQKDLSIDYLRGKVTYTVGVSNSLENDYDANSAYVSISQDMFGDLTTVSLSASRGWDKITRVQGRERARDPNFERRLDRDSWSVGVSQVLTKHLIGNFDYEAITEQGYLQNPYRAIRFLSPDGQSFSTAPEVYPETRTSNAAALRLKYYLPWRAAVTGGYRYFFDTWDIRAHTGEVGYTQPFFDGALTADLQLRYYVQSAANFYSDLFPRENFQNFVGRDKELAAMNTQSVGLELTWDFLKSQRWFLKRASASVRYDYIMYSYDDFRDASVRGVRPGTEPLYEYDATVGQIWFSVWF